MAYRHRGSEMIRIRLQYQTQLRVSHSTKNATIKAESLPYVLAVTALLELQLVCMNRELVLANTSFVIMASRVSNAPSRS